MTHSHLRSHMSLVLDLWGLSSYRLHVLRDDAENTLRRPCSSLLVAADIRMYSDNEPRRRICKRGNVSTVGVPEDPYKI